MNNGSKKSHKLTQKQRHVVGHLLNGQVLRTKWSGYLSRGREYKFSNGIPADGRSVKGLLKRGLVTMKRFKTKPDEIRLTSAAKKNL